MLNWNHLNNVLSDRKALGLHFLFIFMVVYIVSTGSDHRSVKIFLLFAGLGLVALYIRNIAQPLLWYIFLTFLISDLISDYFVRANHHFLLIYLNILIIIFLHNSKIDNLLTNIRLLLVIVLLFSGLQKLISPQFISGDFYYYMINTGNFFKPIFYVHQDLNETVIANKAQIEALGKLNPNDLNVIKLQNIVPKLDVISQIYAWFTIFYEILIAILLLWKPRNNATYLLFMFLILGIFLTRLESGFMGLLAICGIWLTDSIKLRALFATLTIAMLSIIITRIGFY